MRRAADGDGIIFVDTELVEQRRSEEESRLQVNW